MSLHTLSSSILVTVLSLTTLTGVASAASFSDVPSTHPNAEAIAYVKTEGIVEGYADGTFKPNATINRAEFTKIIMPVRRDFVAKERLNDPQDTCRIMDGNGSIHGPFSDVQDGAWYEPSICYAYAQQLVHGYPDGTFHPERFITFVEAAKIMNRTFNLSQEDHEEPWYRPYVRTLSAAHAIPMSITTFDQPITRGEMAEIIWRLKAGITTKPSRTYESFSSAKTAPKNSPIAYRGSDYNGIKTIFTLELPANWVGFGAMLGDPRTIAYIGDATKYGTKDGGAQMEVTQVLTNENSHGRQEGQSWFDFYIGADSPGFIITKQEKRGDVQYYELTAKDQRTFPFPYFFLFETDEALVGLAFKQNDITTQSMVASFAFEH